MAESDFPLIKVLGSERQRIEDELLSAVKTSDEHLTELAQHLIVAGGKRLRPVLTMVAGALGDGTISQDVVRGGVSCELVHLGSLYHDDVMDESPTRRGVETVNASGETCKRFLPETLLARASEIAASLGTEIAALLAKTIAWLCEGQIEELRTTYDPTRTNESYFASIRGKTASLYGTSAQVGGIVTGLDRPVIDALTQYGDSFGMLFQIVDDVLDIVSTDEKLGKQAGHDMQVGVYTLPVLCTLSNGGSAADRLRELLGETLDENQRVEALTIVRGSGGVEAACTIAKTFVETAMSATEQFPDGRATEALRAAPQRFSRPSFHPPPEAEFTAITDLAVRCRTSIGAIGQRQSGIGPQREAGSALQGDRAREARICQVVAAAPERP